MKWNHHCHEKDGLPNLTGKSVKLKDQKRCNQISKVKGRAELACIIRLKQ